MKRKAGIAAILSACMLMVLLNGCGGTNTEPSDTEVSDTQISDQNESIRFTTPGENISELEEGLSMVAFEAINRQLRSQVILFYITEIKSSFFTVLIRGATQGSEKLMICQVGQTHLAVEMLQLLFQLNNCCFHT